MHNSPIGRRLVQYRQIHAKAYLREDGLWDIEVELNDTKGKDFQLAAVHRLEGQPIHRMLLTITINEQFDILEASSKSLDVPYPGFCETINPDYQKLVGLNLLKGFRAAVKDRLGDIAGCTHLTELTNVLPTVAIQAFVGEVFPVVKAPETIKVLHQKIPFHFNGCHALRTDGEVVKTYHPVWFGYPTPDRLNKQRKEENS